MLYLWEKINTKLLAVVLVVGLVSMAIISTFMYYAAKNMIVDQLANQEEKVATEAVKVIYSEVLKYYILLKMKTQMNMIL